MTTDPAAVGAAATVTAPPSSAAVSLADALAAAFGDALIAVPAKTGELTYEVPTARLAETAERLRDGAQFKFEMCMDVCGIDYLDHGRTEWLTQDATSTGFSRGVTRSVPTEPPARPGRRFAVVYHLLSITHNQRLRLRVFCPDDDEPMVDSMVGIWAGTEWFERETFDLFGIFFRGHPDLRRLLTDYGFIGHPFRKDFPLSGNVEVRYDPEKGRVIYQPVSIDPRVLVPKVIRHDNRYDPLLTNAKPNG
jgi:NADH-quinone oxidoreductase subunit C